ncbi:MAG: hypothetical protein PHW76_01925 [Alphaproteobacteria bacterium]|nr:hypothetical protein [Alphaproteobacteria bacterium]
MKLEKASLIQSLPASESIWRAGDWVEVRSLAEILGRLDDRDSLESMPFMPEMIPCCGQRFRILKVAHKTCDSTGWEYLRAMKDAVHLDLRCNGLHHGGCQAGCLFFWKTAWLRKVDGPHPLGWPEQEVDDAASSEAIEKLCCVRDGDEACYRCQATELKRASTPINPWDLSQYVKDLKTGNVSFADFVRYGVLALLKTVKVSLTATRGRFKKRLCDCPTSNGKTAPGTALDLKAGDQVRIKTWPEILTTLDEERRHAGLLFDPDMVQYCGTTREVARRVERIIDEKTGKMVHFSTSSVILEGVACTGLNCRTRLFCTRGQCSFWREAWLEKVVADDLPPRPEAQETQDK